MIKTFKVILFICSLSLVTKAQVVQIENLTKDHKSSLTNGRNYSNTTLNHFWKYTSSIDKVSSFQLILSVEKRTKAFDVQIRNLISATYITIKFIDKNNTAKSLSCIYDKSDKWLRIKMAPNEPCRQKNAVWSRHNYIKSWEEILDHIIKDVDNNLVLDCFI